MPPNAPECPTRSRANAPRMPPLTRAILWPLPGICGLQSDGRGAYPTLRGEQSWALARTGPNETQARWPSQFLPIFRACLIQTGPKLGKNWRSGLFLISPHSQVVVSWRGVVLSIRADSRKDSSCWGRSLRKAATFCLDQLRHAGGQVLAELLHVQRPVNVCHDILESAGRSPRWSPARHAEARNERACSDTTPRLSHVT